MSALGIGWKTLRLMLASNQRAQLGRLQLQHLPNVQTLHTFWHLTILKKEVELEVSFVLIHAVMVTIIAVNVT